MAFLQHFTANTANTAPHPAPFAPLADGEWQRGLNGAELRVQSY